MKVLDKDKDYVRILENDIAYLGDRLLIDFEVVYVGFSPNSKEDHLVVEIKLKRRFLFQLVTIYFPSLSLIIIVEMTLFLGGTKFDPTLHMVLTAMLVMYTLYLKVSSELPPSSYMKLIDIWLHFCLVTPFAVFIMEGAMGLVDSRRKVNDATGNKVTPTLSVTRKSKISRLIKREQRNLELNRRASEPTTNQPPSPPTDSWIDVDDIRMSTDDEPTTNQPPSPATIPWIDVDDIRMSNDDEPTTNQLQSPPTDPWIDVNDIRISIDDEPTTNQPPSPPTDAWIDMDDRRSSTDDEAPVKNTCLSFSWRCFRSCVDNTPQMKNPMLLSTTIKLVIPIATTLFTMWYIFEAVTQLHCGN